MPMRTECFLEGLAGRTLRLPPQSTSNQNKGMHESGSWICDFTRSFGSLSRRKEQWVRKIRET